LDSPITIVNSSTIGLAIIPTGITHAKILPISAVKGKYIFTTQLGASITIKRISSSEYLIENMVGKWKVEP